MERENANPAAPRPEAEPLIPEALVLDLDDVAKYLAMLKEDATTRRDRNLLINLTLMEDFLGQLMKLYEHHRQEMAKVLAHELFNGLKAIRAAIEGDPPGSAKALGTILRSPAVGRLKETLEGLARQHQAIRRLSRTLKWLHVAMATMAAVNVACAVVCLMR